MECVWRHKDVAQAAGRRLNRLRVCKVGQLVERQRVLRHVQMHKVHKVLQTLGINVPQPVPVCFAHRHVGRLRHVVGVQDERAAQLQQIVDVALHICALFRQ